MTEELRDIYEGDRAHYDIIRAIIKDEFKAFDINSMIDKKVREKMSPIYWMFGILVVIYIAVAAPLTGAVISNSSSISTKVSKDELDAVVKERERDYLKKFDYYQIEKDEHDMMKEAFIAPVDALKLEVIINRINENISNSLGFRYGTTRGIESKK